MAHDKLNNSKFTWKGLALHYGKRKTPVLTLIADATYPHLFRIRYPDGWTSTPANLSRAKDAAMAPQTFVGGGKPRKRYPGRAEEGKRHNGG